MRFVKFSIICYVVLFCFSIIKVFPDDYYGLDPLNTLQMINSGNLLDLNQSTCKIEFCPEAIKKLDEKSNSSLLYNLLNGISPEKNCFPENESVTKLSNTEEGLSKQFLTNHGSFDQTWESCIYFHQKINPLSPITRSKNITSAQFHYYIERLNKAAIQRLNSLKEIDFLLGNNESLADFKCNNSISDFVRDTCQKAKSCEVSSGLLDEVTKISKDSLISLIKLKQELRDIALMPVENSEQKKIQMESIEALNVAIGEIEDATPWLKGKLFKNEEDQLRESVIKQSFDESKNQRDVGLLTDKEQSIFHQKVKSLIIRQLDYNKKEFVKQLGQFSEAASCLKEGNDCKRFELIVRETPRLQINESKYTLEEKDLLGKAQCLHDQIDKANGYNDVVTTSGEIGLGFVIGGIGGVAKVSATAARIIQKGNRIKGALSAVAISGLVAAAYKNFNELKRECKKAAYQTIGMETVSDEFDCYSKHYPQVTTNYTNCLLEFGFLIASTAPAVLKKIGKSKKMFDMNKHNLNLLKNVSKNYSEQDLVRIEKIGQAIERMDEEEAVHALNLITKLKNNETSPLMLSQALKFSETLGKKERMELLKSLLGYDGARIDDYKGVLKKFHKQQMVFDKKVEQSYGKFLKKTKDSTQAKKLAIEEAEKQINIKNACRGRKLNSAHVKTGQLFSKITVGLGMTGTAAGYVSANFHKPKNIEWMGKLSYEIVMSYLLSQVGAKIMKNPSSGLFRRYVEGNVGSAIVNGIDAGIYGQIFGIDEDDARDRLNKIKNSSDEKEAMEKLSRYVDENSLVEKFEKSIVENYQNLLRSREKFADLGYSEIDTQEIGISKKLTVEDLNDPKMKEQLIDALMTELYDKERGYLSFGNKQTDRWMYDRGWNALIGVPKSMTLALPFYYSLCLAQVYPVAGISSAVTLQALNQFISANFYFDEREVLINQ